MKKMYQYNTLILLVVDIKLEVEDSVVALLIELLAENKKISKIIITHN